MRTSELICRAILFIVGMALIVADLYVGHYLWLIGVGISFVGIYDAENNSFKES